MAICRNESMGFVDAALDGLGATRAATLLERLDAATPWETLAAPIRQLPEYNAPGAGHPAWCPVLMLKCLMLAKWFSLSDPGREDALKDRISFRKFVGLSFTDKTPDETTFVRFRARLREARIHAAICEPGVCSTASLTSGCGARRSSTTGRSVGTRSWPGAGPGSSTLSGCSSTNSASAKCDTGAESATSWTSR